MALNKTAKTYIKTGVISLAIYSGAAMTALCGASMAYAADAPAAPVAVAMAQTPQSGTFVKSSFNIKGDWQIVKENGQTILRFLR